MTEKDVAKRVIDALPEGATFEDILHALYVRGKFIRGEREVSYATSTRSAEWTSCYGRPEITI